MALVSRATGTGSRQVFQSGLRLYRRRGGLWWLWRCGRRYYGLWRHDRMARCIAPTHQAVAAAAILLMCFGRAPGGGAIRLNVTGMLLLNGRISADGEAGLPRAAGRVRRQHLADGGNAGRFGTVSANGGMGNGIGLWGGGGGGGGRIAIQYGVNLFFGIITARGGSGSAGAAPARFTPRPTANPGARCSWTMAGRPERTHAWSTSSGTVDLTVQRRSSLDTAQLADDRHPAGRLQRVAAPDQLRLLTVTGNATSRPAEAFIADGAGYPGGLDRAPAGITPPSGYIGGGGGYGGYGAAGGRQRPIPRMAAATYGSVTCYRRTLAAAAAATCPYAMGGARWRSHPPQRDGCAASGWKNLGGRQSGGCSERRRRVRRQHLADGRAPWPVRE